MSFDKHNNSCLKNTGVTKWRCTEKTGCSDNLGEIVENFRKYEENLK